MKASKPELILRAAGSSAELRAVLQAAMLADVPIPVRVVDPNDVSVRNLSNALPVGSVEFITSYMKTMGIAAPSPMSYPVALDGFLGRRVDQMPLHRVRGDRFIKPVATKTFNGFVWRHALRDTEQSERDLEQIELLRSLDPETLVWVAEPLKFLSEWRYYVIDGQIVGEARYDPDGDDAAPPPDRSVVHAAIAAWGNAELDRSPAGFAIDFGVAQDGRTLLVEANDGWALGFYGAALHPREYLRLLWSRWVQVSQCAVNPRRSGRGYKAPAGTPAGNTVAGWEGAVASSRRSLLLDVLTDDGDGSAAARGGEVAAAPEHVFPVLVHDVGTLLAQQAARDTLQAVHELGQLHVWRVIHQQVHVVVLAVHLNELRAEVLAHAREDALQRLDVPAIEYFAPVFRCEHQMRMDEEDTVSTAPIFNSRLHRIPSQLDEPTTR